MLTIQTTIATKTIGETVNDLVNDVFAWIYQSRVVFILFSIVQKFFVAPFIIVLFAYLELGGNWFGLRLIQGGPTFWSVTGTILFSVAYSLTTAVIVLRHNVDMGLLMVNYGFGFSIVSIFLKLEWGKIPTFSNELVRSHSFLWIVAAIAVVGFGTSLYLLLTAKQMVR